MLIKQRKDIRMDKIARIKELVKLLNEASDALNMIEQLQDEMK